MSRTYRKKDAGSLQYLKERLLHEWVRVVEGGWGYVPVPIDQERVPQVTAKFHADADRSFTGPRNKYLRPYKRAMETRNAREIRRWMRDPGYDPQFVVRHRNSAKWDWW